MFFGLPLRTMRLTTDFETRPFVGVFAQSSATSPALTRRSMSGASENVDDVGRQAGLDRAALVARRRRRTP